MNVALNAALFLPGEGKYRDSIEGGYASMAKFISEYPDPFGWNPVQYGGLPTHDWYLPFVPYLSAFLIKLFFFLKPEHVYRLVVTTATCAAPATVFLFVNFFTRSRKWGIITALVYTFFSPSYSLYWAINWDRGITYLPWRMQVLTKYGEGPHSFGVALIPVALIACWQAAVGRRYPQLLLASVLLAVVALTNWVAALALGWCVLMMLISGVGSGPHTGFLGRRILLAGMLAYLLACFWLTPSFIYTTLFNWPADAFNYQLQANQWQLLEGLLALVVAIRLIFLLFPRHSYLCFLLLCFGGFAYIVTGFYWYGLNTIPESRRYAVEFEMFFFILFGDIWRRLVVSGKWWMRDAAVAVLTMCVYFYWRQPIEYVTGAWHWLRPLPRTQTIEYRVAEFLSEQHPEGRVFATGGTRFRLNSWFLIPQLGGTFETGLSNRVVLDLIYQVRNGTCCDRDHLSEESVGLLRAAGVQYLVVHPSGSAEHWKDMANPGIFEGTLQPVHRDGNDLVYKIPFAGMAHLVRREELPAVTPGGKIGPAVRNFVAAISDSARPPLSFGWRGSSEIRISGPMPQEAMVSALVSWNPGWRAEQDGKPIEAEADALGHILLHPKPSGTSSIVLRYHAPFEQKAATAVSLFVAILALRHYMRGRRKLVVS